MRDPSVFVYAILGMVALGLLPVLVSWARRRFASSAAPALERQRREHEIRVKRLLEKDSHIRLENGHIVPKCRHCASEATRRPLKWVRNDGVLDLIRRAFGAPARVRVGQEPFEEPIYCESHEALAHEEFRIQLVKYESDRAAQERDWEVRRARFQQVGVHSRLESEITEHERDVVAAEKRSGPRVRRSSAEPGKVVPLRSTGTDSK